jgi:hypothetical protein
MEVFEVDVGDVKNMIDSKAIKFLKNVKPNNLAPFQMNLLYFTYGIHIDTPPNSLKYSNVSPKVKITKEGVGVFSLPCNILGVRGACWSSGMGIRTSDKWVNYSYRTKETK